MSSLEHLTFLTFLSAATVITIVCGGFYLSMRTFPRHRLAGQVLSVTIALAIASIFSVGLNQLWSAKRDRDARVWTARRQHLEGLQHLLRTESASLQGIAQALHEERYFTLVADDARKAVWQDDALTADVERHFPEYFRERERLIREILNYDRELGHIRGIVSASVQLTAATEPYRSYLVPALVNKCGGAAPGSSFVRLANESSISRSGARAPGDIAEESVPRRNTVRTYEQYRCTLDLERLCQNLLDRAADLADAALLASDAARRYAEETVLHGSCTYAPAE